MRLPRPRVKAPKTPEDPRPVTDDVCTKKKSSVPEHLANARTALELAAKLAPLIPVPFLHSIFESAQVIVNTASQIRDNKLQSAELAEYAAQLTHDVHNVIRGREKLVDNDLNAALQQLQVRLQEIQDFFNSQVNSSRFQNVVQRGAITEKLNTHKTGLQYAMSTFTTTSSIWTRMTLRGIENQLEEQASHLVALRETAFEERKYDEKNRYRIYRQGEVYRLTRLTQMNLHQQSLVQNGTSIEYYEAEVEGRCRIVKGYHDLHVFRRALDILGILSECQSVNVAQLEGHSPLNSVPHFLVLKGDLRPFLPYVMSLTDAPRYLVSLRAMGSIVDTTIFLRRHRLTWTNEVSKLMLNPREEVVLGVTDDIRTAEQAFEPARIPILTDWGIRDDGTLSYRRSKLLTLDKMRSEQPTIGALQRALIHPEPSLWTIDDIASLWCKYVAEWGSVLLSSKKTTKIPQPEPSVGFGHLQKDRHGHPRLLDTCPVIVSDQCLRSRSFHVTLEGRTVPSNYSLFHGLSSVADVREVRATVRRDVPHITAWEYMLRFGPKTAIRLGIKLEKLIFVYQITQRLSAFLDHNDSTSIWFHVQPSNEGGFLPEPWGYFSTEHESSQIDEIIPVQRQGVDKASGKLWFSNNPPGVSAAIKHYYKISYIQLHPRDAAFVEWMHRRFSKPAVPATAISL